MKTIKENKDIILARQCIDFLGFKCIIPSCKNESCPLNKIYDKKSISKVEEPPKEEEYPKVFEFNRFVYEVHEDGGITQREILIDKQARKHALELAKKLRGEKDV